MLSCKEITELATEYMEGSLPWRQRLGVRMHLWMCTHCRRYMDQMRKVVEVLKRLPSETAPPDILDKLLLRFREKGDKPA